MLPLAAVFCSVAMESSAKALSLPLVGEPTTAVRETLRQVLPTSSGAPAKSEPAPNTSASNSTAVSSSSSSVRQTDPPVPVNTSDMAASSASTSSVRAIQAVSTSRLSHQQPVGLSAPYLTSSINADGYAAAISQTASGQNYWLEPTESGWKLFGVLWYWWLLLGAMAVGTMRYLTQREFI